MLWVLSLLGVGLALLALGLQRRARRVALQLGAEAARLHGELAEERFARMAAEERMDVLETAVAARAARAAARPPAPAPATPPADAPVESPKASAPSEGETATPPEDLRTRAVRALEALGWSGVVVLRDAGDGRLAVEAERGGAVGKGTVVEGADGQLDVRLAPAYRAFP